MGTDKITFLKDNNVNIWNDWADMYDSIGPTYGYQWKRFNGNRAFDQIGNVVREIRMNPESRRLIVAGWNPLQTSEMQLPPCITQLQFLSNGNALDLIVTQRSADIAVGVPYDIAEMALLLHIVSLLTNRIPGMLKFMYGDLHIYSDHVAGLTKQLKRFSFSKPILWAAPKEYKYLSDFKIDDFKILNYSHGPFIKYNVHV
jgi:thymidylate synthase